MRTDWLLLGILLSGSAARADEVCNPANLAGPYAFQLAGSTDISGTPQPTVSLGRLVFDGSGNLSGTASAMLSGFLLGNPVTGSYEAKPDCSAAWKLQDDSGAYQHFSGTLSSDGTTVQFRQTDPGGAQRGIMKRISDTCEQTDLRGKYDYSVSGSSTPMQPGEVARSVSAKGTLDTAANDSLQVESDCSIRFQLTLTAQNAGTSGSPPINLRGFLVDGGKGILAIQTDPGAMVTARFTWDGK